MKLSTRARYGVRALLDLALQQKEGTVQLKDVASRQSISLHYLEHLITPLIAAGIIRSIRGARGGVQLGKNPGEIKLSEIVSLLEGSIMPVECLKDPESCPRINSCAVRDVWTDMKNAIENVLESVTLQDLVDRQKSKEHEAVMYYV